MGQVPRGQTKTPPAVGTVVQVGTDINGRPIMAKIVPERGSIAEAGARAAGLPKGNTHRKAGSPSTSPTDR